MKIVLLTTALAGSVMSLVGWLALGSPAAAGSADLQTLWYPNGQVQAKAALEDGVRQGPASEWYASGQQRCSGEYREGLREGPWVFFAEDGTPDPARSGQYVAGLRVSP
ncbi:MAG: hypothetical protein IPK67_17465 [Planctomycetes bacterium]|nr:hypothetical protein [Planctomycetota bacterium]